MEPVPWRQTARGYTRARPDYHPQAVAVAARLLELDRPVKTAADLGCGTGMSTRALRAVAHVIGFDVSHPMLLAAEALPGVSYARAAAERLPLQSQSCDLVAAAAAFHWFDQTAMLAEVRRVLRPGGALLAYTDFFSGRLREEPRFTDWLTDVYRQRFPLPPRRSHFDQEAAESFGFRLIGREPLAHEIRMTADQLAEYMLTQSNATSAIDNGRISLSELHTWLLDQLADLLPSGRAVAAQFTGQVWCCRCS